MTDIYCNECKKYLFSTDKSGGAVGAIAQSKGFIYKLPILYTDKYPRLFFCSEECCRSFYDANIPKNSEINKKIESMKADVSKRSREIADGIALLKSMIKKR